MVVVVFRRDCDRLAQVCSKTFATVKQAKDHIEDDAAAVCAKWPRSFNDGWILPKTLDYYLVTLGNGVQCIWQYFKV